MWGAFSEILKTADRFVQSVSKCGLHVKYLPWLCKTKGHAAVQRAASFCSVTPPFTLCCNSRVESFHSLSPCCQACVAGLPGPILSLLPSAHAPSSPSIAPPGTVLGRQMHFGMTSLSYPVYWLTWGGGTTDLPSSSFSLLTSSSSAFTLSVSSACMVLR